MFTNGGMYEEVTDYIRVEDEEGNVVVEKVPESYEVISGDTATIMNRLLQQVVDEEGGTGVLAQLGDMPVIGKTGTSDQGMDYLFVGATPYYKSVLWLGYPYPERTSPRYNYKVTSIWQTLMQECHRGLQPKAFVLDTQIVELDYCIASGNEATANCKDVRRGYYKEKKVPSQCNIH